MKSLLLKHVVLCAHDTAVKFLKIAIFILYLHGIILSEMFLTAHLIDHYSDDINIVQKHTVEIN